MTLQPDRQIIVEQPCGHGKTAAHAVDGIICPGGTRDLFTVEELAQDLIALMKRDGLKLVRDR